MLRIVPLILLAWLAAAQPTNLAPAPASPATSRRVILYIDADSPLVATSIKRLDTALERRGIRARHDVVVRHVAVDVLDRKVAATRIAAALREHPAMIIATSSESASIAREVTSDVPIVFGSHQDPVRLGLVRSLSEPGANLTGFTAFVPIDLKRLELLREAAPKARRLGIVIDRWWMDETDGPAILRAAQDELGFEGRVLLIERAEDLRELDSPAARKIDAWYVPPTVLSYRHAVELVHALAALRKPVVYPMSRFTDLGGLLAYQPNQSLDEAMDLFAKVTGLVLDGVPPATIPVERPQSFDIIVNLAEARRLGIELPEPLLKRADHVIDRPLPP
jgi:putative ABC transport system substrate-binding protein